MQRLVCTLPSEQTVETFSYPIYLSNYSSPRYKSASLYSHWVPDCESYEEPYKPENINEDCIKPPGSPIPCRICLQLTLEELIKPCECKGSLVYVHQSCLKTWILRLSEQNKDFKFCELCKTRYNILFRYKLKFINKIVWVPIAGLFFLLIGVLCALIFWAQDHSFNDPLLSSMVALVIVIGISVISLVYYVVRFECYKKDLSGFSLKSDEDP